MRHLYSTNGMSSGQALSLLRSSLAKRRRQVNTNLGLVQAFEEYLPAKRQELDQRTASGIARKFGQTNVVAFR